MAGFEWRALGVRGERAAAARRRTCRYGRVGHVVPLRGLINWLGSASDMHANEDERVKIAPRMTTALADAIAGAGDGWLQRRADAS